jgi:BirA family biotin operon repressor/biotin-[acetyl-CoA-carboxylase] ligase
MLDADQVRGPLSEALDGRLEALDVFDEIESTNSYLLAEPAPAAGCIRVALADHQTAGRGRRGRRWVSPPTACICLSLSYTFTTPPRDFPAATIAVGIGVARSLESLGLRGVGLKWPNDVVIRDGKLGGILTEVHTSGPGLLTVVVGVGINVDLRDAKEVAGMVTRIGDISDLASCMSDVPPRSIIAVSLIEQIVDALMHFEAQGLGSFLSDWNRLDWLHGQCVSVDSPEHRVSGICEGIEENGALVVRSDQVRHRIHSGSVYLGRDGDAA